MPVLNRIADYAPEMTEWRRYLHQHPETRFDCPLTAGFIAAKLREFGVDAVHEGIAQTGIVAIIEGAGGGERERDCLHRIVSFGCCVEQA